MALTQSADERIGMKAADFSLPDTVSGQQKTLQQCRGEAGLLLMIICNHCPYVVHVQPQLAALGRDYQGSAIGIAAMSANDAASHPADSPENMKKCAIELGYAFPYLYDEKQEVARSYRATCTPDFLLFDKSDVCVYSGRLCPSTPGNGIAVTGSELRHAMDELLAGRTVAEQHPSMGCSIKWRS